MKTFVFITFLLLGCTKIFAEEEKLVYDSLDFEIRYFNAISKSAVVLQEYFDKYPVSEHESIIKTDRFINNVLKKELYEIADVYTEQYEFKPSKKRWFLNQIKKLDPRKVVHGSTHLVKNRNFYLRKYGIGLGIAMSAGFMLEFAVPVMLVKTGMAYLIPASVTVPYGVILATLTVPSDILLRWRKERSALGLNYPEYVKMRRQIKKRLKTVSELDLLFPVNLQGSTSEKVLTIQKTNLIDKTLSFFNLSRKRSNYYTIKSFLRRNKIQDKYTKWIISQKSLNPEEKTLLLVHHLFESNDEKIQAAFITHFSTFFTTRPKLPRTHRLKSWTRVLIASKSSDDIAKAMSLVPPGTPPLVVVQIWEELAIAQFVKHIPMSVGALRNLKRELEVLRAISSTKPHRETWNLAFAKLFSQKINPIIQNYSNFCHKNQKDFFHFLLNHPL